MLLQWLGGKNELLGKACMATKAGCRRCKNPPMHRWAPFAVGLRLALVPWSPSGLQKWFSGGGLEAIGHGGYFQRNNLCVPERVDHLCVPE
jgi:hypothetical protein